MSKSQRKRKRWSQEVAMDLLPAMQGRPPEDLFVMPGDPHPNAAFFALHRFDDHRRVKVMLIALWVMAITISGSSAKFIYFDF